MSPQPRPFSRAIALSLATHIALFGGALAFAHFGNGARIIGPRVVLVALVGGAGGEGRGPGPTARRETVRRDVAPAEAPTEQPERSRHARSDAAPPADAGSGMSSVQEALADSSAEGHGSGVTAGGPADAAGGLSSSQWQLVQSALERSKTYPRVARERGIEGTVLVRFRVLPSGEVESVDVVRSSGAAVLDEATVHTVYRAAPMPYVSGWVEVPMVYRLQRAEEP